LVFSSNRPETLDGTISRPPNLPTEDLDEKFIGEEVGGCKILSKIARGGMGTVYLGEQIHLGRRVAVKILAPELARDESFVKRFIQEARAVAELSHPSIIHIIDAGAANGCFYFTMEYIEGENLSKILKQRGPIPLGETLNLMEQVADALCHAHSRGIVHRDIKPDNILVTQAGQVKLADLGLAKRTFDENASAITQAGSILGTPYYMAPEQARDFRLADERSDLYSLGVTIYKVLSGSVPYDGHSPIEVMMKALQGDKIPLDQRDPSIPAEAVALVDRMMHVDPAGRFKSAEICRNAIQSLRRHLAETAR